MSIAIPVKADLQWTYVPSENPNGPLLKLVGDTLSISRSSSINAQNQWNRIKQSCVTWGAGRYFSFHIKLDSLSTQTEVKIDFPGGIILRHNKGQTHWVWWNGSGFNTIAQSNINFGDNLIHVVELAYTGNTVEIFEDGVLKGNRSATSGTVYEAEFGFQVLAAGAGMDAEMSKIQVLRERL